MMALVSLLFLLMLVTERTSSTDVHILSTNVSYTVSQQFLSFAIDGAIFDPSTPKLNFSSPRLVTLLSALSPAVLRVGGSPADYLVFNVPSEVLNVSSVRPRPFTFSKSDWDNFVTITLKAKLRLLFDLNLQLRFGESWDPSNAIELFKYSTERGYGQNIDWELGNEPNVYTHSHGQALLSGTQIGKDFVSLANIIGRFPAFKDSRLVGPDVVGLSAGADNIFKGYLAEAGSRVDALTMHHYYFRGDIASWTEYLNTKYLSNLEETLMHVKKLVNESAFPQTPVWFGETSDAWHSGTAHVSDRYVSAFLWLDKLGLSAQHGVDVVIRQTVWGHNYCLINLQLYPNPDYWLSLLHKRLVGRRVLQVSTTHKPVTTRIYAHCAGTRYYKSGAVTVFMLNMDRKSSDHVAFNDALGQKMDVYLMTGSGSLGLLSPTVALNGQPLKLVDDYTLPHLKPVQKPSAQGIDLLPTTYAFIVFPDADFSVCK